MDSFRFLFTRDEANLVLNALGKMPYETVAALVASIQSQAQAQLDAQKPSVTETEAPKPVRKPRKPKTE